MMGPILESFVDTGKIEIIFLDMPLDGHPHAFKAAEAGACADDQKMFWEMHHALFDHQQNLASAKLPGYAAEVGLDVPAFQKCLDSGQHEARIREDLRIVHSLGLSGTPDYLLGRRVPGGNEVEVLEVITGTIPYEKMEKKLNELLASK